MKVQKVQEVLCSGFLDVLRLSSLRSRYLSVYEKVRLLIMEKCTIHVCLCTYYKCTKFSTVKIVGQYSSSIAPSNVDYRYIVRRDLLHAFMIEKES